MLLTDLRELKGILEIDPHDPQEDRNLGFFVEWASKWIEELLNRPGLSYAYRTEFYEGTGTPRLCLRSRPVFTVPSMDVRVDTSGYWGAASGSFNSQTQLTYGSDYALQIDEPEVVNSSGVTVQQSRCGILWRLRSYWPQPSARQAGLLTPFLVSDPGSIRVSYQAGYTVDTLPAPFRMACNTLVAKMRYLFPLGMELVGDGYEEKNISILAERKDYLLALIKPMIWNYRNWNFGGQGL